VERLSCLVGVSKLEMNHRLWSIPPSGSSSSLASIQRPPCLSTLSMRVRFSYMFFERIVPRLFIVDYEQVVLGTDVVIHATHYLTRLIIAGG